MLYMQDWHICVPADFSLGFEGDNNAVTLEISTDLPEGWDLKVDVAKESEKNIIQLNRRDNVYYALLTSSRVSKRSLTTNEVPSIPAGPCGPGSPWSPLGPCFPCSP